MPQVTAGNVATLLKDDTKVKVAGVDADGILRGKLMAKEKFLASVESGFGFSSAVFGWDMHDVVYTQCPGTSSAQGGGYPDITAVPDLASFRRVPWEDNVPFFLLRFYADGKPVVACPRGLTSLVAKRLSDAKFKAYAGGEHQHHYTHYINTISGY